MTAEFPNQQTKCPVSLHEMGGTHPPGDFEVNFADGPLVSGIQLSENITADVMTVVKAGQQEFGVFDTKPSQELHDEDAERFALVRVSSTDLTGENPIINPFKNAEGTLIGAWIPSSGEEIIVGRSISSPSIERIVSKEDMALSAGHFRLSLNGRDGKLHINDRGSSNGSKVYARKAITENPIDDFNDDTVDFEQQDDATRPKEQVVNAVEQVDKPKNELADEIGEVAVEEVVEEPAAVEQQAEIQEAPSARRKAAINELRESWNFKEDASEQEIVRGLTSEFVQLTKAMHTLRGFDDTRKRAVRAIHETQASRGPVYLGPKIKGQVDEFLHSAGFASLISDDHSVLPANIQSKLTDISKQARLLSDRYQSMTKLYTANQIMLDMEHAGYVASILGRQFPAIEKDIIVAYKHVSDMIERLGIRSTGDDREKGTEDATYRTEEFKQWAEELSGGLVSPERLDEIISDIENRVQIESEMDGDPNSPRVWFGDSIYSTFKKARAQGGMTGRGADAPHTLYVAELTVDILGGKFIQKLTDGDAILLDRAQKGGVRVGQHRAAALAMIYGNKWPEIASKLGFKIEREDSR